MRFLTNILAKAGLVVDGAVTLNNVAAASTNTDRFLVVDSGVVKYRTGSQLLSDISAVGGSGTAQYLSVFTGANTVGNSILYQDGTKLGVNTSTFSYTISGTGSIELNGSSRAILGLKVGNAAKGYILHAGTDMEIANTAAGNLDFNTNSTTRGRIDASGVWKIYDLIGSGNRVVIASSSGTLSAVPASTLGLGTVTSVDMSVPTGFAIANNPVTTSGTLALSFASGYSLPTTASQSNWNTAYNDSIVSAAVTGTTTKTLTLTQQDGGTVTASWTDYDTAPVTSVFGRTGAVVAQSGDYTTTQVTEGINLYYTDSRARQAITLTTNGSSGVSTYSSVTGVLNIPNYSIDLSAVAEDILPLFSAVYDLGSSSKKWYDLYLSNTLHLGDVAQISVDNDNDIIVNTNLISQGTMSATVGDFGDIMISANKISYVGTAYSTCIDIDSCLSVAGNISAVNVDITGEYSINGTPFQITYIRGIGTQSILSDNTDPITSDKNYASGDYSVIAGGAGHKIWNSGGSGTGLYSTISGGYSSIINGNYSTISGGRGHTVGSQYGTICGGQGNTIYQLGNYSSILGGNLNVIYNNSYSVILGGLQNQTSSDFGFIGAGYGNNVSGNHGIIVGGEYGIINGARSTILSGYSCQISGVYSTIINGNNNEVTSYGSTITNGQYSKCQGNYTLVGGHYANSVVHGQRAYAAGPFNNELGSAQQVDYILRNKTTDGTPVTLRPDGSNTNETLTIASGKTLFAIVNIAGIKSDGSSAAHYIRKVAIKNVGGTTSLIGTVSTIGTDVEDNAAYDVTITADNFNDALQIDVTGVAGETIRWVAHVEGVEIGYGS